jgi:hypothetical protein
MAMNWAPSTAEEKQQQLERYWKSHLLVTRMVGAWEFWTDDSTSPPDQVVKARLWDDFIAAARDLDLS